LIDGFVSEPAHFRSPFGQAVSAVDAGCWHLLATMEVSGRSFEINGMQKT